jgi:hypothetical protein
MLPAGGVVPYGGGGSAAPVPDPVPVVALEYSEYVGAGST